MLAVGWNGESVLNGPHVHCFRVKSMAETKGEDTDVSTEPSSLPAPPPARYRLLDLHMEMVPKPEYVLLRGATHRCVALRTRLTFSMYTNEPVTINIPQAALPFGLVRGIRASEPCSWDVYMVSGNRTTKEMPSGWMLKLSEGVHSNDYDSHHAHVKDLKTVTKHDLRYRAVAGVDIAAIILTVRMATPTPCALFVDYEQCNAIPAEMNLEEFSAGLTSRRKMPLRYVPVSPATRVMTLGAAQAAAEAAKPKA